MLFIRKGKKLKKRKKKKQSKLDKYWPILHRKKKEEIKTFADKIEEKLSGMGEFVSDIYHFYIYRYTTYKRDFLSWFIWPIFFSLYTFFHFIKIYFSIFKSIFFYFNCFLIPIIEHLGKNFNFIIFNIIDSLILLICLLISVAFFTLLERKKLSSFQNRKGPNKVGYLGLLQPIADALKLMLKEIIIPRNSDMHLFLLSPILAFMFGFLSWILLPFSYNFVISNINLGVLLIFCVSIFHVFGIIFAGWSSNSRYSFLGALRSSAQLIAYDISMGIIILNIILFTKTLNLIEIVEFQDFNGYFVYYLFFPFLLFLICILAETNRHPFDLPEAESELVSGYNVEYSAIGFALFFLAEYAAILFISYLTIILFLGGWIGNFFLIKLIFFFFFFLFMRAAIPRYRYDQLMRIGWKFILPLSLSIFFLNLFIYLNNNFIIFYNI